jgi:hypothetical protein
MKACLLPNVVDPAWDDRLAAFRERYHRKANFAIRLTYWKTNNLVDGVGGICEMEAEKCPCGDGEVGSGWVLQEPFETCYEIVGLSVGETAVDQRSGCVLRRWCWWCWWVLSCLEGAGWRGDSSAGQGEGDDGSDELHGCYSECMKRERWICEEKCGELN